MQIRDNKELNTPEYCSGKDIVFEVITKLLDGTRKWDMERVPNLNTYMYKQIDSYIYNLVRKNETTIISETCRPVQEDEDSRIYLEEINFLTRRQIESDYDNKEFIELCRRELTGDGECADVFELIIIGCDNIDTAARLNLNVRDVVNIKRRIKRKLQKFKPCLLAIMIMIAANMEVISDVL